jgi:hypothetical protein
VSECTSPDPRHFASSRAAITVRHMRGNTWAKGGLSAIFGLAEALRPEAFIISPVSRARSGDATHASRYVRVLSRAQRRNADQHVDLESDKPEFWREVQPPASLKGLDIPPRRAVFVPWKPNRRPAFGMGNPTFR